MVTFLSNGLLTRFSGLFVFLFVFIVIWGMLESTKVFGKGKEGANALVALFVAIFVILSERVTAIISFASPWFVILFIMIFFILVGAKFFGGEGINFTELIKEPGVYWSLVIIGIVILLVSFIQTADKNAEIVEDDEAQTPIIDPQLLGAIVIFLIAIFAVIALTGNVVKK